MVNGVVTGSNSPTFSSSTLANGDIVKVKLTSSNGCAVPPSVTSNAIVMTVNPILVPEATISIAPSGPVCAGSPVTLTVSSVNPGTGPVYQWLVNNVPTGGSTSSITLSNLSDGDTINVRMVSDALCAAPVTVLSNTLEADIIPYLLPDVTINMSPSVAVCDGDTISFHAIPLNGGPAPVYNWLLNGNTVSGVSGTDYAATFNDGDTIQVILTSNYQCLNDPTDSSNIKVVQVIPNVTPSVTIAVDPLGAVCPGDLLTFTATAVNAGGAGTYEWTVNGVVAGTNNPVFSSSTLSDGDIIRVKLTSSIACVTAASAFSNTITVQISPTIIPDANISVLPVTSVCKGDTLKFTSAFTGGGGAPSFEWRVNGISTGVTTSSFISTQLNNGDVVDLVLISSAFCASPSSDTSNQIIALIDPLLTPVATINANPPGVFCDGKEITYSASGIFGGTAPSYQWMLNGQPVGTNNIH
jgi:hypothetical protein